MYRGNQIKVGSALLLSACLLSGCWSSKEIEDQAIYTGLALDVGTEDKEKIKQMEQLGSPPMENVLTGTIQIVPQKSFGSRGNASSNQQKPYVNSVQSGNSVFEIMRMYSLIRDRPVIGHHLKVIVLSTDLLKKYAIDQLLDFTLRDNDIRPSCLVFLARGQAAEAMTMNQPADVPSFHIKDMERNRFRNNKIMKGITLTNLNALMNTKQSYILQTIASVKGKDEFYGAGIIKGKTGKWIGNLDSNDVASISWIRGTGQGGLIKTLDERDQIITYEIKSMKSKIIPKVKGDSVSFHVEIKSKGRLIENWDAEQNFSKVPYLKAAEKRFERKLASEIQTILDKMQSRYKVDVSGFGKQLSLSHPQVWKKVKDDWDDVFSRSSVTFTIDLTITDYGSSTG
ncbi:Ger(x)C family spore germination protein [Gorillibacterium sp. CAU 1737]|uniref:Ger(x)C family spore germination protein n=1 Tax=Gorillibacterium sp. CAU 1737 TaxID=3140362 RepID=UPI0032606A9E